MLNLRMDKKKNNVITNTSKHYVLFIECTLYLMQIAKQ